MQKRMTMAIPGDHPENCLEFIAKKRGRPRVYDYPYIHLDSYEVGFAGAGWLADEFAGPR